MFLNERSPINAKIRTQNAELLMLRKIEAIEIYSLYPNIWKRINKISLHNMEQIYLKIRKYVIKFAKMNNIDINKFLSKRKRNMIIKKNVKKIKFNEKSFHNEVKNNLFENYKNNNENMISNETKENLYKKEIIIEPSSQYENSSKITKILNLPKKDLQI